MVINLQSTVHDETIWNQQKAHEPTLYLVASNSSSYIVFPIITFC